MLRLGIVTGEFDKYAKERSYMGGTSQDVKRLKKSGGFLTTYILVGLMKINLCVLGS